jgi:hypothetical protein
MEEFDCLSDVEEDMNKFPKEESFNPWDFLNVIQCDLECKRKIRSRQEK